ncbi:MAG TPA: hypothetical protein PLI75_07120 [Anaerolineales bacterium]|nr:hypothetical protein [Anaerolineales bacterium]
MADNEISLERQDPAEEEKKKADSSKQTAANAPAPVLVEFTITVSVIFLVLVFFTVSGVLLVKGSTLLDFVFRTSVSLVVIGGLLAIIARQISSATTSQRKDSQPEETSGLDPSSPSEVK